MIISKPGSLTLNKQGDTYIIDETNCIVRKVNTTGSSTISLGIFGNCTAYKPRNDDLMNDINQSPKSDPNLPGLTIVSLDRKENIYITTSDYLRFYNISSKKLTTIGGGGINSGADGVSPLAVGLNGPLFGLVISPYDFIYLSETIASVVRVITPEYKIFTVAGSFGVIGDSGKLQES